MNHPTKTMKFPFEVSFDEVSATPEPFIDAVFSSLASEFLILPKGEGFVEYSDFVTGYEELKKATAGFTNLRPESLVQLVARLPICLIVLRAMLGFTPPEWAYTIYTFTLPERSDTKRLQYPAASRRR